MCRSRVVFRVGLNCLWDFVSNAVLDGRTVQPSRHTTDRTTTVTDFVMGKVTWTTVYVCSNVKVFPVVHHALSIGRVAGRT